MKKTIYLALAAAAAFSGLSATSASAAGCNGVVNPFVWHCAPWDNNNGPQFPYFQPKKVTIPAAKAQIVREKGVEMVKDLRSGQVMPIISRDGAGVVAAGGLN
jgi:hypothetical protein